MRRLVAAGFGNSTAENIDLPDDVIGAFTTFDILKTAEMARNLQPNARHLYIIGGSSEFDRGIGWRRRAPISARSPSPTKRHTSKI